MATIGSGQPLPFVGLASQKNYISVYLYGLYFYSEEKFRQAWASTGKKLDMGKCCVRFKKIEDVALDVIADALREITVKSFIKHTEAATTVQRAKEPKKRMV
jgi:hypothetical protein